MQDNAQISADHLQTLCNRIGVVCKQRGWDKHWTSGGCYIHLEVSEFIEALRGKGDPVSEAADVLIAFFAVLDNYNLPFNDILRKMDSTLDDIVDGSRGAEGNK